MHKSAGFTLIEVLVSVVILSTGIIVVLYAFQNAAVALGDIRDTIWAGNIYQGQLSQLKVEASSGSDFNDGFTKGVYSTYYADFNWERNIMPNSLVEDNKTVDSYLVKVMLWRNGSSKTFKYDTYIHVSKKPKKDLP